VDEVPDDPAAAALLAVRFGTELALLGVLALVGARLVDGTAASWTAALLLPLAAAVVWGLLVAPRARRRLPDPARLVVEVVLFLTAAGGLAAIGATFSAGAFAVTAVGVAVLVRRRLPGA
jgi:hypothetical protein